MTKLVCSKFPAPLEALDFDILAQAGVLDAELANSLKKAVGFRNIAMHNYDVINWHIVHSIVKNHLADFSVFAKVVATRLDEQ